ncbi:MAG: hypothetical protein U0840_12305 [Gemmataceae bacterium]
MLSNEAIPANSPTVSRAGGVLLVLAALLAAMLASVPVQHADFWGHLAAGRAFVQRTSQGYAPLLDASLPSSGPTSGWLYDVVLYGAYSLLGGGGVLALHALLAALIPVLAVRAVSPQGTNLAGGVASVLIALVLGPWLVVQPAFLALVFVAALLYLLPRAAEVNGASSGWSIVGLVILWANLDNRVVLAPGVVGLVALGELLRGELPQARRLSVWLLLALVGTILSPSLLAPWLHLPGWWAALESGAVESGRGLVAGLRGQPPAVALSLAGLVGLALAGLVIGRGGPAWRLAPLGILLVGAALLHASWVPFLALVAGSLAATALAQPEEARTWRAAILRGAFVMAALALTVLAWPGWLQGGQQAQRCWRVDVDASLRQAVEQLARWRGSDTGPQALTLSREAAAYAAWFTPNVPPGGTLTSDERETVWMGLVGQGDAWRTLFRQRGVRFLIVSNATAQPGASVVARLAALSAEWPLIYLRGNTVIFGWNDGAGSPLPEVVDLQARAFSPGPADRAPSVGPEPGPWWSAWTRPWPPMTQDRDEAALYLAFFDAARPEYQRAASRVWMAGTTTGLSSALGAGQGGPAVAFWDVAARMVATQVGWSSFIAGQDDGPYGATLLAVRAARRGLAQNPDDARCWFLLGEAYLRLAQATRERDWRQHLTPFDRIRKTQAIAAFTQAVRLRPDSVGAHGRLVRLYRENGSMDLTLDHLTRLLAATRSRGPGPGQPPAEFAEELQRLDRERTTLEVEVRKREQMAAEYAGQNSTLAVAREARSAGLYELALQTLLKSDASEFGAEGSRLELDLLLWTGRLNDVRAWAIPELRESLGDVAYLEVQARLAASEGHYAQAEQQLSELATSLLLGPRWARPAREQAIQELARSVLLVPGANPSPASLLVSAYLRLIYFEELEQAGLALRQEANALVVAGLVALEAGEVEQARAHLLRARATAGTAGISGLDFPGRQTADECLQWLNAASRRP